MQELWLESRNISGKKKDIILVECMNTNQIAYDHGLTVFPAKS